MTTEELCQRVAKIEGYEFDIRNDVYVKQTGENEYGPTCYCIPRAHVLSNPWILAGPLIEKYRLTIKEDGHDWCVMTYGTDYYEIVVCDEDLLTAVFKAVIEVNK